MNSPQRIQFLLTHTRRVLRNKLKVRRRMLRSLTDPFEMPDARFVELFRLTKTIARNLIAEMDPYMEEGKTASFLPKELRFLVALRFFSQGSFQRSVGQDSFLNVSQSSVSRCVTEVSDILDRHLLANYVKFPSTAQEIQNIKSSFYESTNFPGVIGLIDGSHIKIKAPISDLEHIHVCRKGGHSMNLLGVCNSDLKVIYCNARFGGSAHDASVWRSSALMLELERRYAIGGRNFWLLGDSGYPQLPYLMTPIPERHLSMPQQNYNRQHRKTRNRIERCFGLLKSRFRCISKERVLCYDPLRAGKIINSCIVLHNIIIKNRIGSEDDLDPNEMDSDSDGDAEDDVGSIPAGITARQQIVDNFFSA